MAKLSETCEKCGTPGKVLGEVCPICSLKYPEPENPPHDPVNRPAHYTFSKIEPIAAIEAWGLGFCLGNAVKYIARAKHKGNELEDCRKAQWYLARHISGLEGEKK